MWDRKALLAQIEGGKTVLEVVGRIDEAKVRSSALFFIDVCTRWLKSEKERFAGDGGGGVGSESGDTASAEKTAATERDTELNFQFQKIHDELAAAAAGSTSSEKRSRTQMAFLMENVHAVCTSIAAAMEDREG